MDKQEMKNKLREAFNSVAEGYDNPRCVSSLKAPNIVRSI
jgi:hypothetical protein